MERIQVLLQLIAELEDGEVRAKVEQLTKDAVLEVKAVLNDAGIDAELDDVTRDREIDATLTPRSLEQPKELAREYDNVKESVAGVNDEFDKLSNQPPPPTADAFTESESENRRRRAEEESAALELRATSLNRVGGAFTVYAAGLTQATQETTRAFEEQEAALAGVEQIFGGLAPAAEEFASSTDDILSSTQALSELSAFGTILDDLSLTNQEVLSLSENLLTASQDIGVAFGVDALTVAEDLRAAIEGDNDALAAYNITLSDAAIQQEAFRLGLQGANGELDEAALEQARLNLILEQTGPLAGTAAASIDDSAQAALRLAANAEDAKASVGEQLQPAVQDLQAAAIELIPVLTDIGEEVLPQLVQQAVDAATVLLGVANAADAVAGAIPGFDGLGDATGFANNFLNPLVGASALIDQTQSSYDQLTGSVGDLADESEGADRVLRQSRITFDETAAAADDAATSFGGVADAFAETEGLAAAQAEAVQLLAEAYRDQALSETELADIGERTGLNAEQLAEVLPRVTSELQSQQAASEEAAREIGELRAAYADSILGIVNATANLEADDGLAEFFANQQTAIQDQAAFFDNLNLIELSGADNLADQIVELLQSGDIEGAARLAAEAAELGYSDLQLAEITAEELDASQAELEVRAGQIAALEITGEGPISRFVQDDIDRAFEAVNTLDFGDPLTDAFAAADLGSLAGTGGFDLQPVIDELEAAADGFVPDFQTPINEAIASTEVDAGPISDQATAAGETTTTAYGESLELQQRTDEAVNGITFNTAGVEASARAAGRGVGLAITDGIEAGIAAGRPGVLAEARSLAQAVTATIQSALQIQSPSRVAFGLGLNVAEGFALGLSDPRNLVPNASNQLAAASVAPLARANAAATAGGLAGGAGNTSITDNGISIANVTIDTTAGTREGQIRQAQHEVTRVLSRVR